MAITTTAQQDFDVQVLSDTIRGTFAQKNALMGSPLAQAGAIVISDTFPGGQGDIDTEVTVPYFGTIGDFVSNADGSSVTPVTLSMTNEKSTVTRDSLAFEVSKWAQARGPSDPYVEASAQIMTAAERAMDARLITAGAATPLVHDVYSSSVPRYLDYGVMADATARWGDENSDIVGLVTHSRTLTDLRKLTDTIGRPLLIESQKFGDVPMFMGVPVIQSDRTPITGSTMGTVTSAGTTPPVLTLTGTPLGAFNLKIKCIVGGAHTTATIQFSTDGGNTWSATLTTNGVGVALALTDTAKDSLVGVNGRTGVSAAFAAGTFATDNTWISTANLKVNTLVLKRGAMAFWYNRQAMALETDKNILAHTDIAAMHLYAVAHRYRRARGGTKPGVLAITHNVSTMAG